MHTVVVETKRDRRFVTSFDWKKIADITPAFVPSATLVALYWRTFHRVAPLAFNFCFYKKNG
jgi:hypothetical protein